MEGTIEVVQIILVALGGTAGIVIGVVMGIRKFMRNGAVGGSPSSAPLTTQVSDHETRISLVEQSSVNLSEGLGRLETKMDAEILDRKENSRTLFGKLDDLKDIMLEDRRGG